jgi:hypothetical protein
VPFSTAFEKTVPVDGTEISKIARRFELCANPEIVRQVGKKVTQK